MKSKASIAFACLAALLLFTAQALTLPRGSTDLGENFLRAMVILDLSGAQKADAARILQQERAGQKPDVERFRAAVLECVDLALADDPDEEALRESYRRAAEAGEEVLVKKAKMTAELRRVLSPEQRRLMADFREQVRKGVQDRVRTSQELIDIWVAAHAGSEAE